MPDLLRKVHRTRSSLPPIPPIGQDWNTALRVPWEKDHRSENRSIMDGVLSSIQAIVTHPLFQQVAWAVIIVIATRVVEKLTVKAAIRMLHHGSNPLPSSSIIINIVRAIIWIVGASIVLDSCFGVNTSSVIAALGVGGIAVSLGFQDTLSNLIGGLQVTFMGIVKPGDNIEVGSERGVVQDVTWRHTTIKDSLGQTVIIPNSIISTTALVHLLPASRVTVPFSVPRTYPTLRELEARRGDASAARNDEATTARDRARAGKPVDLDELSAQVIAEARRAAESASAVTDGPSVFFSEVGELGIKGSVVLTVADASKTSAAKDAVVRAIAAMLG